MFLIIFLVIFISLVTIVSSIPDAILPYQYGIMEDAKNSYGKSPTNFLYGLWQEVLSMRELNELRSFASPKDFLMKMLSLFVSRLFLNLQSITLNFLFMLWRGERRRIREYVEFYFKFGFTKSLQRNFAITTIFANGKYLSCFALLFIEVGEHFYVMNITHSILLRDLSCISPIPIME